MGIALGELLTLLARIAPLDHAEAWDNVGLLVDAPEERADVQRALLTIDLTPPVLEEAIDWGAELVIAYHPPIFKPLGRLTRAAAPVVFSAIRAGIAVYSPHTAADAAPGGVNDWLADALPAGSRAPLAPSKVTGAAPDIGMGRSIGLSSPIDLEDAVSRIKQHLGLERVRVATSAQHQAGAPLQRVAVCAGAGGALFAPLSDFDLYVTGEMRHHDVLAKVAAGSSVILCDHSNTERGYLGRLAEELLRSTGSGVEVRVSQRDRDPLVVT